MALQRNGEFLFCDKIQDTNVMLFSRTRLLQLEMGCYIVIKCNIFIMQDSFLLPIMWCLARVHGPQLSYA
jgi:hypothetical protein